MHPFTIALSLLLSSGFTVGYYDRSYAEDAAVKPTSSQYPTQTIPASCTTTRRHALATHSCYTATAYTTRLGGCERLECPPRTSPVFCPLFIVESTVAVPCKTDCCPTTATTVVTTPCPSPCPQCPTPTHVTTITTGCPA
ncbi:hypothetical protein PG993_015043 [Apiospora rasikravindrae]|uniref:Uncharacterized protein n=1 Tax=Apiospora rasikravindrae TaxID=990691 RepID=A0ABR1RPH5_9PEZI